MPILTEEHQTTPRPPRRWGRWVALWLLLTVALVVLTPAAHPVDVEVGGRVYSIGLRKGGGSTAVGIIRARLLKWEVAGLQLGGWVYHVMWKDADA
jgi:hypothetical protein